MYCIFTFLSAQKHFLFEIWVGCFPLVRLFVPLFIREKIKQRIEFQQNAYIKIKIIFCRIFQILYVP